MASANDLPEGATAAPSTYPNALANNVNMHRFPAQHGDFPAQNDPIRIDGAKGSAFDGNAEEEE